MDSSRIEGEHRWNHPLQQPDLTASIAKETVRREAVGNRGDLKLSRTVSSQPSECCAGSKFGEVQMVEVGSKSKVRILAVKGKCSIRRNLDDCNGSHQVEVAARRRANRQAPYGEDGADEFDSMVHTRSFISASTLDRHGRANLREGCRLYTDWLLEIHDRATEEARQMKVLWFETVDAGVMRVVSTVVMNIDAGERPFAANDFEHLPQKRCGRSIRTRGAGP